MVKLKDFVGGIVPAVLGGAAGKENRGFGLGVLPGLLYQQDYRKQKEAEEEEKKKAGESAVVVTKVPSASGMKKGGKVKAKSSASKRADGCAVKGKTRGKMV